SVTSGLSVSILAFAWRAARSNQDDMTIYPVIMCGGAGTRLWPSSRPARPKQFIPLAGNRSLFQETAERVAPLAGKDGKLVVVAGVAHREWLLDQLAEIGLKDRAQILLEPEARDSAA